MIHLAHTILSFLLVIGVLVFVHELGHYLAARWRGVRVEVFSIGMGRRLCGWHDRNGTDWRISAIPIGGYVRMLGQADLALDDEPSPSPARADRIRLDRTSPSFADKSVLSRAIVVAAGPLFNFLFAIVVFAGIYAFAGKPSDRPVVAGIVTASPAARAGLLPGDAIESIGGVAVRHVADVPALVATHPGEHISLLLRRDGHAMTLDAVPDAVLRDGRRVGQLGIQISGGAPVRLSLPDAFVAGAASTFDIARQIAVNLWSIVSGHGGASNLGGTLRIAQVSGQAASAGPATLAFLLAMISVNLGMVNLLPVPVLDGGNLVFYAAEALLGRPLSRRAQALGLQAGLALIAGLILFTTFNDLNSFGLFHWVQRNAG
jgi:regulator of sigma E protease